MGVIFTLNEPDSPILMDCSAGWGQRFVRLCNFVSSEYKYPSIFLWDGEIISDFIYLDIASAQSLFAKASENPDVLLVGWAECIAGMLEIATQLPMREKWLAKFPHFRPRYNGVDRLDIPVFEL